MIQPERVQVLNRKQVQSGKYVLYWMQASQRAQSNHALEYAVRTANDQNLPIVCFFGLTAKFPEANLRHYAFMLEGLKEVETVLKDRGILLIVRIGNPPEELVDVAGQASAVVVDRGYLRVQKKWRKTAARRLPCPLIQVESDAIVPVEITSQKEEYAAATIRSKIHKHLSDYLAPVRKTTVRHDSLGLRLSRESLKDVSRLLAKLRLDRSAGPATYFVGGTSEANRLLRRFIHDDLKDYATLRNNPAEDVSSGLSPYLHFGQISPLHIALSVSRVRARARAPVDAFLEELIVRRELSLNFVHFNDGYDSFDALPDWARQTLESHLRDKREYAYSPDELEEAGTHDPYWNAAMSEMLLTGSMHNYMRMYWGKKVLEWSPTPEKGFKTLLYLNNKYFLDGRDPNSFAGVAWCFGKHDRPWAERKIFGKVRYMNEKGLERKFNMRGYLERVKTLESGG